MFSNILYLSLSNLILVSDREGIDNPFIALGASVWLFVQVLATSWACVGFSLEEERVMQQSRDKYFPQIRTKVSIQEEAQASLQSVHLHKLTNTCTQREKGVVHPFMVSNKSGI